MTEPGASISDRPNWAVIDIGSNSIRLVMYEGPARCPVPVFNEKMLCGLGQTETGTKELRQEAMDEALQTLKRFRQVLNAVEPDSIHVFATAAVRDAPNGLSFLAEVEEIGFSPLLLSGEDEAKLAAYGILSGAPDILERPHGALAGDIGGGSLELSHIKASAPELIANSTSLPLGALRLSVDFEADRRAARGHIRSMIEKLDWLAAYQGAEFHMVGGAWRALARIAILDSAYPVEILDQYTLSRQEMVRICSFVSSQSADSLASIPVVQRRRAPTLPFAALILEEVIRVADIETIRVASSGVREGILFAQLSPEDRQLDPLKASAEHVGVRFGSMLRPSAETVSRLLGELFPGKEGDAARWRHAAAILCNFSNGLQPDERAIHSAMTIMGLPFRGISHEGRIFLSAALAVRHGADEQDLDNWLPMSLLDPAIRSDAMIVGLALRFLSTLSPGGGAVLDTASFDRSGARLRFDFDPALRSIWAPAPAKRFDRLASALGVEAELPF